MSEEFWRLDATAQSQLVRSKSVSATELVSAALERIAALDPRLGSIVGADAERALAQAARPGDGVFAGVPFIAKDLLAQPGLRCAFGSRLFAGFTLPEASPYAHAIDAAGLITLGKGKTSELGLLGSTETLLDGLTRNPWDLDRSAGGSSGGSAAAVAAGLVPIAHASDGGGSIRIPAALCGLFGFKPSRGRCLPALPPSDLPEFVIDHCVTRSVRDSARFLEATEDRSGRRHEPIGFVAPGDLDPLRIGFYSRTLMGAPGADGGRAAVESAAALCGALGHRVQECEPPPAMGEGISMAFFTVAGASIERLVGLMSDMRGAPVGEDELEPFTWATLRWYQGLAEGALDRAHAIVADVAESMRQFLDGWDVVLCPTVGVDTPELGFLAPTLPRETLLRRTEALAGYTPVHNMVGAPAMTVPLVHQDGLPVGCQFAAPAGRDATLLALAYQLEEAAPWADRWPAFATAD